MDGLVDGLTADQCPALIRRGYCRVNHISMETGVGEPGPKAVVKMALWGCIGASRSAGRRLCSVNKSHGHHPCHAEQLLLQTWGLCGHQAPRWEQRYLRNSGDPQAEEDSTRPGPVSRSSDGNTHHFPFCFLDL